MENVIWHCPCCGQENVEQIEESFCEIITKNFNCNECDEEVLCCISYKPVVTYLDLV